MSAERLHTVVVGGGQAGLAVGYHLARRQIPFVILDAHQRIGDAWRRRWHSLRLFSPARYDALPGMAFPAPGHTFPTKNEMADYLESYAARFQLPVRTGVRVRSLSQADGQFLLDCGDEQLLADNVVVAMSSWQQARTPAFAAAIDPRINQLHAADYHDPSQFAPGDVLVVGAGNSGGEIALDASREHRTWLAGRDTGQLPFRIDGWAARLVIQPLVLRFAFHHVLTVRTPLGRRIRQRALAHGMPLIRLKASDFERAGITRVPRVTGVSDGLPQLADGRTLDVTNVVWCTGFDGGLSWVHIPVLRDGEPVQNRGVTTVAGLYFVGRPFIYSASSAMVQGVGRDAGYVVRHLARRAGATANHAGTPAATAGTAVRAMAR